MRPRLSPSFVVAVLALVVAVGGTGYAAGLITSRDIKDSTIVGRDIKDGAITGPRPRPQRDQRPPGA